MVYGDNRKYLVALITLNEVEVTTYAKIHNIPHENYQELVNSTQIQEVIANIIKETNQQVSTTEQIKKYNILSTDFSIEKDEITPTGKVKRKNVTLKYQEIIDKMYT